MRRPRPKRGERWINAAVDHLALYGFAKPQIHKVINDLLQLAVAPLSQEFFLASEVTYNSTGWTSSCRRRRRRTSAPKSARSSTTSCRAAQGAGEEGEDPVHEGNFSSWSHSADGLHSQETRSSCCIRDITTAKYLGMMEWRTGTTSLWSLRTRAALNGSMPISMAGGSQPLSKRCAMFYL